MTEISNRGTGALSTSALSSTAEDAVTVGSLCTGTGALDIGFALALGIPLRHAWHVENDAAPSKILTTRFPGVPNYGDLKTLDYALMERVDLLTAGYPCQPFSDAGLRKGADDPRHLWPYVADTIGALRPRLVLLENVRGHVRRGLDSVLADLAALGYDASWGVVRASDAGAPHRRERIFIVAQDADRAARSERWLTAPGQAQGGRPRADIGGRSGASAPDAHGDAARWNGGGVPRATQEGGRTDIDLPAPGTPGAATADTHGQRLEGRQERDGGTVEPELEASQRADVDGRLLDWGIYGPAIERWARLIGRPAPWATEPRGRGGAERLSPRFVEWMMGMPAGWVTDVPGLSANEQLKALGNGVVPQQAALAVRLLIATTAAEAAA